MTSGKTYIAIGDVHGCYQELEELWTMLKQKYDLHNPDIVPVFLGNYIDRGESSLMTIGLMVRILRECPHAIVLSGNHEKQFLDEGVRTFNDIPDPTPEFVLDFFKQLRVWHESDRFLFVHGGPSSPDAVLEEEDTRELLWNYIPDREGWHGKIVVKGHTTVSKPSLLSRVLYLDTGCCFGGFLSCAVLDDCTGEVKEFISIASVHSHDGQVGKHARKVA